MDKINSYIDKMSELLLNNNGNLFDSLMLMYDEINSLYDKETVKYIEKEAINIVYCKIYEDKILLKSLENISPQTYNNVTEHIMNIRKEKITKIKKCIIHKK